MHLKLLRLVIFSDKQGPTFFPTNLEYLRVSCLRSSSIFLHRQGDIGPASTLFELATEQCLTLSGVEFYGELTTRIIRAISRFKKFVANLNVFYYIQNN